MRLTVIALALTASVFASAQYGSINSTRLEPRFYNDVPGSTLTSTNIWPSVNFNDQNVSQATGFANRHVWSVSNDGGATSYLFGGTDAFTVTQKIRMDVVGAENKEAGIFFLNPGNGDHIFLIKTSNNGEIAAFAGGFPFYTFTGNYNDHYVPGTTVTMSVTYFKDTDNVNKAIYRYNNHFSGAQAWGNNEGELLANTQVGGYCQIVNDPNTPTNAINATFSDITVSPANKAFAENVTATLGRITDGNKQSLNYSDGQVLRACKGFVPNLTVAPVTIQIDGTSVYDTLSALAFHVNSRMSNVGIFTQTLDLFDWSANGYSATDVLATAINSTFSAHDVNATGTVSRYLGAGHELRGRIRVKQTGFSAVAVWCAEFDEANFTVAK